LFEYENNNYQKNLYKENQQIFFLIRFVNDLGQTTSLCSSQLMLCYTLLSSQMHSLLTLLYVYHWLCILILLKLSLSSCWFLGSKTQHQTALQLLWLSATNFFELKKHFLTQLTLDNLSHFSTSFPQLKSCLNAPLISPSS